MGRTRGAVCRVEVAAGTDDVDHPRTGDLREHQRDGRGIRRSARRRRDCNNGTLDRNDGRDCPLLHGVEPAIRGGIPALFVSGSWADQLVAGTERAAHGSVNSTMWSSRGETDHVHEESAHYWVKVLGLEVWHRRGGDHDSSLPASLFSTRPRSGHDPQSDRLVGPRHRDGRERARH